MHLCSRSSLLLQMWPNVACDASMCVCTSLLLAESASSTAIYSHSGAECSLTFANVSKNSLSFLLMPFLDLQTIVLQQSDQKSLAAALTGRKLFLRNAMSSQRASLLLQLCWHPSTTLQHENLQ